jgi:RNA-directed DNA polymerase
MADGQIDLFPPPSVPLEELFDAYFTCRKNKRRTANAAAFEVNYEENLVGLWREINDGTYLPGRSLAFIVNKPVKREIFAADFRDRIVHHLIVNKINHLFEREFIHDSYACRVGRGTHFGINRIDRFIRRETANYAREAWILKLDIKGFFMSIDRGLLFTRLEAFLRERYTGADREIVIDLCRKVIFADPARNCFVRGSWRDWDGLPPDKSLFWARPGCGLPIGNLTSQVFANFYLNSLDHFIKHTLGMRSYGRYVDDFVIVHQDRNFLAALIPLISEFLSRELHLTLHPRKIHLQPAYRGVQYLGTVIKPGRTIIANRTKGNFAAALDRYNRLADARKPSSTDCAHFQSSINSYLGILRHYATGRLRAVTLGRLSPWWWWYFVPVYEAERGPDRAGIGHGGTDDNRIPTVVSVKRRG